MSTKNDYLFIRFIDSVKVVHFTHQHTEQLSKRLIRLYKPWSMNLHMTEYFA